MELSKPICHSSQSVIVVIATTGIIYPHLKLLYHVYSTSANYSSRTMVEEEVRQAGEDESDG